MNSLKSLVRPVITGREVSFSNTEKELFKMLCDSLLNNSLQKSTILKNIVIKPDSEYKKLESKWIKEITHKVSFGKRVNSCIVKTIKETP